MTRAAKPSALLNVTIGGFAAAVLGLDLLTPLGWMVWLLYVIPLFLAFTYSRPRSLIPLAGASTVLMFARLLSVSDWDALQVGVANRTLGAVILWVTTVLLLQLKRTEAALQLSGTRAELALSGADLGLWDIRIPTGEVVYDRRWAEMLGYTLEEFESHQREWKKRVHPDDLPRVMEIWNNYLEGKIPTYENEHRLRAKSGHWVWVLTRARAVEWDHKGHPLRVIGTLLDITERKQAEEALRMSEARFRSAFSQAAVGLAITDDRGRFVQVNSAFCAITGYPEQELCQKDFQSITHPDDLPAINESIWRLLAGGTQSAVIRTRQVRKSGDVVWVQTSLSAVRDRDGKVINLMGLGEDITETKTVLDQLTLSEQRFSLIIEHANDAIFYLDLHGGIQWVNAKAEFLTGYSAEDLAGRSFIDLLTPETAELGEARLAAIRRGETVPPLEKFEFKRQDHANLWVEANITSATSRMEPERVIGRLVVARDITERKEAEDALRASERALREVLREREQLAQDLHDGIIQSLYAIGLAMEECQRLTEEDSKKAGMKLGEAIGDINAVIREVRRYLTESEEGMPFSAGRFKAELVRVARTMERANALHFRLNVDQRAAERLTTDQRRELFYIAQEAMSNCLRHSGASIANISLRLERDRVRMEAQDDGVGFDKQVVLAQTGGLRNIARRAATIGAKLEIASQLKQGTRLSLDVPILHG